MFNCTYNENHRITTINIHQMYEFCQICFFLEILIDIIPLEWYHNYHIVLKIIIIRRGKVSKKQNLFEKISKYLSDELEKAEQENKIDYFKFQAQNHKGTLQMEIQFKNREKAY